MPENEKASEPLRDAAREVGPLIGRELAVQFIELANASLYFGRAAQLGREISACLAKGEVPPYALWFEYMDVFGDACGATITAVLGLQGVSGMIGTLTLANPRPDGPPPTIKLDPLAFRKECEKKFGKAPPNWPGPLPNKDNPNRPA